MQVPILVSRFINKHKVATTANFPGEHPGDAGEHDIEYDIEYDVPYIHQQLVNECGEASLTMLLSFHHHDLVLFNPAARGAFEGVDTDD